MNFRSTIILIFLLTSPLTFALALLENGGFNNCSSDSFSPWQVKSGGHEVSIDHDIKIEGCSSLRSKSDGSLTNPYSFVEQPINPTLSPDETQVLSGFIKTSNIQKSATLVVQIEGPEGRLYKDDMNDRKINGTTDWQEFQLTIPYFATATSIKIGVLVMGSGTAWFDDLKIQQAQLEQDTAPVVTEYLSEVLSTMEIHHVERKNIDWESIRHAGFTSASGMQTIEQAYSAARVAIQMLKDGHSGLKTGPKGANDSIEGGTIDGKQIRPVIGYIAVGSFHGNSDGLEAKKFARYGQELIRDLDSAGTCGWIVDLRQNSGGNMWPMIAAVGPLLGEGIVGAHVGADPEERVEWIYEGGKSIARSAADGTFKVRTNVSTDSYSPIDPDIPIAVLIGKDTASSGEAVVVAFSGRANTRSFGQPTSGATTGRAVIPMSNGSKLALVVSYLQNSKGYTFDAMINPDELITDKSNNASQATVDTALEWIQRYSSCNSISTATPRSI